MPNPAAQAAFKRAGAERQRAMVAAVSRIEDAIGREVAQALAAIRAAGDDSPSPAELRRRLRAAYPDMARAIEAGFRDLADEAYDSAVGVWAAALTPELAGALAGELREDDDKLTAKGKAKPGGDGDAARRLLFSIFKPPTRQRVVEITTRDTDAPDGMGWRARLEKWSRRITDKDALVDTLARAYEAGGGIDALTKAIRPLVSNIESSARRIARTEGMRIAHAMMDETYDQAEEAGVVEGYEYNATMDAVTRPEHAALDGRVYGPHEPKPRMPNGPNCVLPDTEIGGRIVGGVRAWYSGPCVAIEAVGRPSRLVVTPNHPILTDRGFVPAHAVHEGDHVICGAGGPPVPSLDVCDREHVPAGAAELFRALIELGPLRSLPASVRDLHGDAALSDGQIDVVGPLGALLDDREAARGQLERELSLSLAGVNAQPLPGGGPLAARGVGVSLATARSVGRRDLGGSALADEPAPLQRLCLGPVSQIHAQRSEASINGEAADAEFFGEMVCRGAGLVAPAKVVKVERLAFSGHVFDFQAEGAWYEANGIIISNCRCWYSPVLVSDLAAARGRVGTPHEPGRGSPERRAAFGAWFDEQPEGVRRRTVGNERYGELAASLGDGFTWASAARHLDRPAPRPATIAHKRAAVRGGADPRVRARGAAGVPVGPPVAVMEAPQPRSPAQTRADAIPSRAARPAPPNRNPKR